MAKRAINEPLLTTADLAARADFVLGELAISPSTRTLRGPAGSTDLEPRVMQVLAVLADASGQVVTRETLFSRCWGSPYVGDDSLNRAVAALRRAIASVGGRIDIETIPRTGYRLLNPENRSDADGLESAGNHAKLSRRAALAGAGALLIAGGGAAYWTFDRSSNRRFDELMAQGDEAFHSGLAFEATYEGGDNSPAMVRLYEQAVRLQPESARAWGLLGYFRSVLADDTPADQSEPVVAQAEAAIRRALALDPNEPNARVGLFLLEGSMADWASRDRQLRSILATDPTNLPAMMELMPLLQATGLTRESWMWNERILKASPFFRASLVVRALKLWILGRTGDADHVIDRVRALWPAYSFGQYARFTIFALTGRPGAARAMLPEVATFKRLHSEQTCRTMLDALELRTAPAIEAARFAALEAARKSPPLANDMVMMLCALGLKDPAFEVTEGFLLWRGKFLSMNSAHAKAADDYNRRMTQWLFTPPVAIMRADPRFASLCDQFGLTAYWKARGVKPDYLAFA